MNDIFSDIYISHINVVIIKTHIHKNDILKEVWIYKYL